MRSISTFACLRDDAKPDRNLPNKIPCKGCQTTKQPALGLGNRSREEEEPLWESYGMDLEWEGFRLHHSSRDH